MTPEEKERYELALRASNEGIWQWDLETQSVKYSERAAQFLGHVSGEAPNIFMYPDFYLHEDDVVDFKQTWGGMLRVDGEDLMAVDCRYRMPEGVFVWLRIRGACVRDVKGVPTEIAGSVIDISRRKNAEHALQEERHLLRQLIENIPNTIYFKDTESRFVMVNRALVEKMKKKDRTDLLGKTDYDFFDETHALKSREDEVRVMETLESQEESIERETWKGQEDTWVLTSKIPWFDSKGGVKGIFGVSSDVSEMVNVQIRLTNVASQLKYRNEEYEKEIELARQVQQSVLDFHPAPFPREVVKGGCELNFSVLYQPDSEMAGDFYEVFPISEGKVGVFICDVMGHGIRSSLVVAMLRGLIEKESEAAIAPERFLYGLNNSLSSIFTHAGIQMFATAFYVVFDVEKRTLEYANAGHPMPVVRAEGSYSQLHSSRVIRGAALGITPDSPYGSECVAFAEVDQLILFTDGIYEIENADGKELAVEGVIEALNAQKCGNAKTSIEVILERAKEHKKGDKYGDDICLLGIDLVSGKEG